MIAFLYSIGISVIFTSNVSLYCPEFKTGNCYNVENRQIIVSDFESNKTFWHEVGHALTLNDIELNKIIDKKDIENMIVRYGFAEDVALEEVKANLYMDYKLEPTFLILNRPIIYKYFNENY